MGYRVKGTLKLPDGGSAQGLKVEFTAGATSQTVLAGTKYTMAIGVGGVYDIDLEFGSYSVLGYVDGAYPLSMGAVVVDATTATGQTLTQLLGGTSDVPAAWIAQIELWLAESKAEADRAAVQAGRAKSEADRASQISGLDTVEDAIKISPSILDSARYALERATGGKQTIIYDAAGNANSMFVLPRFRYEDLGITTGMGAGDVTAFDLGSGSIKGEIFIGAYLASGVGAVSEPRKDPRASLNHTAARDACAAKGLGWHLMTAHEWAAIALWCMANGYEPIGNTNWGRSHAKTWLIGDRVENRSPGDAAGSGRTQTGSIGAESTHDRTLGGIADLVGNLWEWQDGFLLSSGRVIASAYNTQTEVNWVAQAAYFDAPASVPVLASSVSRAASVSEDWRALTKASGYVSNTLLKRLLLEPASALPQGRIYVNGEGDRLPLRGGSWSGTANAGLAAINMGYTRASTDASFGFRPAFA